MLESISCGLVKRRKCGINGNVPDFVVSKNIKKLWGAALQAPQKKARAVTALSPALAVRSLGVPAPVAAWQGRC